MSAILSSEDLNDFISPGVACIKPVETLPKQRPQPEDSSNPYEVTTEDKVADSAASQSGAPAQISLTDCLACSGCVTSAEAVLVSLQSHQEVLNTLDAHPSLAPDDDALFSEGMLFVASVSPQTRASLAAVYDVSEIEAGHMIEHLLAGPGGLRSGGNHGSGFAWILDTNTVREIAQQACVEEVESVLQGKQQPKIHDHTINGNRHERQPLPKRPVLASACPGWICYAEKTHPHILPHLSRVKSPQALAGTLLKTVLSRRLNIPPNRIWHLAVMPCFDKKLEASREELTDIYWSSNPGADNAHGVRDVDCVITARELIMLADTRGISFPNLPRTAPPPQLRPPFPDQVLDSFLFPRYTEMSNRRRPSTVDQTNMAGPSGGYAFTILHSYQRQRPGSTISAERGRNADVVEYVLRSAAGEVLMKTARYYGFRNIQNLVRKLKPAKRSRMPGAKNAAIPAGGAGSGLSEYAYVEVMACPGGCTNGGGQVKVEDVAGLKGIEMMDPEGERKRSGPTPAEQKEWLSKVDEAYYSASSAPCSDDDGDSAYESGNGDAMDIDDGAERKVAEALSNGAEGDGVNDDEGQFVKNLIHHWSSSTGIELEQLLFTTYRQVESDVGKDVSNSGSDMQRVAGLAQSVGGGW